MSSFDSLPNELVAEIFCHLSTYEGIRYILAAVCRNWRDVSYSVPQLWTYIDVQKWSDARFTLWEAEDGLKAEIERSGTSLPLDINWNFGIDSSSSSRKRLSNILVSSASMARWESLDLTGHLSVANLLISMTNRDFTRLEVLKFREFLPPNPDFPFHEMTRVRELHLYGCAWEPLYVESPDFCRRIKSLFIREIYLRGTILPPTLEKVTLFGNTQPDTQHGLMALSNTKHVVIDGPFHLPKSMDLQNLEVLEVGDVYNIYAVQTTKAKKKKKLDGHSPQLNLPNLRQLIIHLEKYDRDDFEDSAALEDILLDVATDTDSDTSKSWESFY
ncbi:hypothetical protein CPB86DRAFT_873362 [Serendipita vermifera]|nr:hypothetical protein CPB86DRAFT_873362 [Serendipita vermifera]